jgi:hypothetical protein
MNWTDFIIGLTLANTIPHFVLGIWKGRILGGLGFGNTANILYGFLNFGVSVSLFIYTYGINGILENGIYLGALFVVVSYLFLAKILYNYFHVGYFSKNKGR